MRHLPAEYRPYESLPGTFSDGMCVVGAVASSAACVLVIVVRPEWAVVKFLLFGGCAAFCLMIRRHLLAYEVRVRLRPFLHRVRRGDVDGVGWLLEALAAMDGWTPYARRRARAALAALARRPELVPRAEAASQRIVRRAYASEVFDLVLGASLPAVFKT